MLEKCPTPNPAEDRRTPARAVWIGVMLLAWLVFGGHDGTGHAAKPKSRYRLPELKIVSVEPTPVPFILPSETPLSLTIMVELPKSLPDDALLDVTTMITSTSRYSIRLITSRQMLTESAEPVQGAESDGPRTVEIVQTWDGTDHTKRVVTEGKYDYQVQAKIMVVGKDGPLTRATAWKKRGNIEVRSQPASRD